MHMCNLENEQVKCEAIYPERERERERESYQKFNIWKQYYKS